MAVKIRLKRMGKIRTPQYRIVVMDSRTKRDGLVYPRRVHRVAAARRAHELEAAGSSARILVADN